MKTALFARYSSKMQDEMSMEAQVTEMEAFCARHGLVVVDRYLMPETRSTDLEKSEVFQQLLADVKAKRWKVLLCHKLDRLGRDRDMVVMFKMRLRKAGIEIRSVVENLSDSIEHRLLEQIHEVFADHYARNLGNETRKGHRQLTRQGYWKGGPVAWGLTTIPEDTGGKKPRQRLASHPVRGPLMVKLFERLAAGEPPEHLRRWIAGVTSEEEWSPQSFHARIKNPIYYGRLEYGRTRLMAGRPRKKLEPDELTVGEWEGIVSKELWDKANQTIADRARHYHRPHGTRAKEPYLMSGLMRCQLCDSSIIGSLGSGHRRYRCANRNCSNKSVRAEHLEPAVTSALASFIQGVADEDLVAEAAKLVEPARAEGKRREAELRRELTEARERQARLLEAIEQGADAKAINERLKALGEQVDQLASEIALAQATGDARADLSLQMFFEAWLETKEQLAASLALPENREDFQLVMRHAFDVELDLPNENGQLYFKLAVDSSRATGGLVYGRSARI